MPMTVEIRDLDDSICDRLELLSAEHGLAVSEYLRRELTRLFAPRPAAKEWWSLESTAGASEPQLDTLAVLDDLRGPWPV